MSPLFRQRRIQRVDLFVACGVVILGAGLAAAGTEGFSLGLERAIAPGFVAGPTSAPDWQTCIPCPLPPGDPPQSLDFTIGQPRAFPARLADDLPAFALAPLGWEGADWRKLGLGVMAVGVVSLVDEPLDRWLDEHRSAGTDQAAKDIRPLGEAGIILLGAAWLGGHFGHNTKLEAIGADGLEATLISALLVYPLKLAFGRERPRQTQDHGSFWSGGDSFPSWETTQAFVVASVVAAHSDRTWVKATVWGLAGLIGAERTVLDAHWASDVVAGALIGASVGRWVVKRNRPDVESDRPVTLAPIVGPQRLGLAMTVSF